MTEASTRQPNAPLSIAATVVLIRRYVENEAKREQLARTLGSVHTALANQCVIVYTVTRAAQDERELTSEELQAFTSLAVGDYMMEHFPNTLIWDYWNTTLARRATAYTQYFEPVRAWLSEWPNIEEHIGLMQLEEHTPELRMLNEALRRYSQALGIERKARAHHSGNRPVTDEAIQWRLDALDGWVRQWPRIEAAIALLIPEMDPNILAATGGLLASTSEVADAYVELHRAQRDVDIARRELDAAKNDLPPIVPPTA